MSFLAVGGLAADHGGYFATTWGWATVILCAIAVVLLAVNGPPRLRPFEKLVVVAIVGLSLWTFLSAIWSVSVTRSMLDGERTLLYVSAAVVALLLSRRAGGRAIVIGTWLAITAVCTYSLLTRLFPDQFGTVDTVAGNRLSAPIGYWNGLGLLAAVGCLLALGLAARGATAIRMAASASGVILVLTLYLTFGRGAWVALAAGGVAALAVDRRRFQLLATGLVVAAWPAIAVYYASQSNALTHSDVSFTTAQRDGHALAVICVFLMAVAAVAVLALDVLENRRDFVPGPRSRWLVVAALVCALAAVVVVGVIRYGSPNTIARNAWDSFVAPSPATGSDLNNRLFHLSGTGRIDHWRVAEKERAAHPWLGSGAGTFSEYWFRLRPTTVIVHDAHNLYLEKIAENGPVGLALVVLLLGSLIVAAARSRSPLGAVAAGACVAYAAHAIADWDWELPALFLAVLLPALAVQGDAPASAPSTRRRLLPAAAVVALGAFALFTLLGNIALARSGNASDATHWQEAEREARSAMDLVPWSAEPLRKLAVAQGGVGDIAGARDALLEAVDREPDDWSLWYQLSEVSTGALHRRALAQATRLNPNRTSGEATPGDLRLVVIP